MFVLIFLANMKSKSERTYIGVVHKLRGQDFDHFWLPTYLNVDIFYPKRGQKEAFFDHLPTSPCPRSLWTTPNAKSEQSYKYQVL